MTSELEVKYPTLCCTIVTKKGTGSTGRHRGVSPVTAGSSVGGSYSLRRYYLVTATSSNNTLRDATYALVQQFDILEVNTRIPSPKKGKAAGCAIITLELIPGFSGTHVVSKGSTFLGGRPIQRFQMSQFAGTTSSLANHKEDASFNLFTLKGGITTIRSITRPCQSTIKCHLQNTASTNFDPRSLQCNSVCSSLPF